MYTKYIIVHYFMVYIFLIITWAWMDYWLMAHEGKKNTPDRPSKTKLVSPGLNKNHVW